MRELRLLYTQERTFRRQHAMSAHDPKQKKEGNLVGYFNSSPEVIRLSVMMYVRLWLKAGLPALLIDFQSSHNSGYSNVRLSVSGVASICVARPQIFLQTIFG